MHFFLGLKKMVGVRPLTGNLIERKRVTRVDCNSRRHCCLSKRLSPARGNTGGELVSECVCRHAASAAASPAPNTDERANFTALGPDARK